MENGYVEWLEGEREDVLSASVCVDDCAGWLSVLSFLGEG